MNAKPKSIVKEEAARALLTEESPVIMLYFENEKEHGLLVAAKAQHAGKRWISIPVKISDNEFENEGDDFIAAVIAGSGHYAEFRIVAEILKELVRDEVASPPGRYPGITEDILEGLSGFLNDEFRNADSLVPYRIELIFLGLLEEDTAKMYRVKYDGDFHPVGKYAIAGGYKKSKGGVSVRNRALRILARAYRSGDPTEKGAILLAKRILEIGTYDGEFVHDSFSWKV